MKVIKIGDLNGLMEYVKEIKFSYGGVMFRGVYHNKALNEDTPFRIVKVIKELDPKEYSQLMDVKLPNGHKVYEVFALLKKSGRITGDFWQLPSDLKLKEIAVYENHKNCKNYGGTCNYCHKRHEIIKNPCACGFFNENKN